MHLNLENKTWVCVILNPKHNPVEKLISGNDSPWWLCMTTDTLKHKDSFGKSENLSKIFFAEILVFDHDYEGKSSSSNEFALNLL